LSPAREESAIFLGINKVIARDKEQENNISSTIYPCPILNRYECPFDKKKSDDNKNKINDEKEEGTLLGAIGFFIIVTSHSTELSLSLNLAIISVGLELSNVGAQNVIILAIPRQNSGSSLGMTSFIRIVGNSIAPDFRECSCRDIILNNINS
jgi:hypothetical protein